MSENMQSNFIGYEYTSKTVKRGIADLYTDCFPSFGWSVEGYNPTLTPTTVTMKFKRDRKLINKVELTRLQREFESHVGEINKLEISKTSFARVMAYIIGIVGTAFMAGSVFAVNADMIPLTVILGIPAFIGWIAPYFCYRRMGEKKAEKVAPLIEQQYDAIYATCEKANALLYK